VTTPGRARRTVFVARPRACPIRGHEDGRRASRTTRTARRVAWALAWNLMEKSSTLAAPGPEQHGGVAKTVEEVGAFFDWPEARSCQTAGRSVTLHPRLSEVTSSSAVWYWSCSSRPFTSASIVTRRARKPLEVSVRWAPVNRFMSAREEHHTS